MKCLDLLGLGITTEQARRRFVEYVTFLAGVAQVNLGLM